MSRNLGDLIGIEDSEPRVILDAVATHGDLTVHHRRAGATEEQLLQRPVRVTGLSHSGMPPHRWAILMAADEIRRILIFMGQT
ncbi:hypothetical protein [Williamsia sp.]|uniref:hypothetical protein n=1 Tax=Williamsia sp. TaxID=1872085 RepID=UPI001A34CD12|nr:hypothetical protein [Williamsia sp.]MBJ7290884.1 hypothetical protein [Williamsia sp.]